MSHAMMADAAVAQQDRWNRYLKSKDIDKVFVEIVKSLIAEQPEKPIDHMIKFLSTKYKTDVPVTALVTDNEADDPPEEDSDDEDDYIDDEVMQAKAKKYNPGKKRGTISSESVVVTDGYVPPSYPKTPEEVTDLIGQLKQLFFTQSLSRKELRTLAAAFKKVEVQPGEKLIEQGDANGDSFYIIISGRCDIHVEKEWIEGEGATSKLVMQIPTDEGRRYFGELAMLYNQPRASTVQATDASVLWVLDRLTFKSILQNTGNTSKLLYSKFLNEVPILSVLTQDEKNKLLDVLKPKDFDAGDIVMKEGDAGDAFYIVDEGSVICTKVIDGVETRVSDSLGHGKFFGELALIKNAPRAATVTAEVETSCVYITRDDFKRMMGPLSELLKKNQEIYAKYVHGVTV